MKDWFPFTDYDFYSYLACGLLFLFGLDFWSTGGQYFLHDDWTFIRGALIVAFSYVVGQVISIPSSIILEHGLARKLLRPPAVIMISSEQSGIEKFIEFLVGRHYSPLPQNVIEKIFINAQQDTGLSKQQLEANIKEIFVVALKKSRDSQDTQNRINFFRNQYSLGRNIAFSSFVLTILFFQKAIWGNLPACWGTLALVITLGMLLRFLKFYSCCAKEVLTSYAYKT